MAPPALSDVTTEGVRVGATAFYLPQESNPSEERYVWGYRVVILNQGSERVQLLSRHWVIIDADGKRQEVRGAGVVGETPVLEPGRGFKYVSGCPLGTPWGTMEGTYQMKRDDGTVFDVAIGRFYLTMEAADPLE